jgi:hypothetical protein
MLQHLQYQAMLELKVGNANPLILYTVNIRSWLSVWSCNMQHSSEIIVSELTTKLCKNFIVYKIKKGNQQSYMTSSPAPILHSFTIYIGPSDLWNACCRRPTEMAAGRCGCRPLSVRGWLTRLCHVEGTLAHLPTPDLSTDGNKCVGVVGARAECDDTETTRRSSGQRNPGVRDGGLQLRLREAGDGVGVQASGE